VAAVLQGRNAQFPMNAGVSDSGGPGHDLPTRFIPGKTRRGDLALRVPGNPNPLDNVGRWKASSDIAERECRDSKTHHYRKPFTAPLFANSLGGNSIARSPLANNELCATAA
jgi:hypothetical protein